MQAREEGTIRALTMACIATHTLDNTYTIDEQACLSLVG
jgi:hypothetical protein